MLLTRLGTVLIAPVLVAGAVASGCGGSADEPGSLSKPEFANQANELCATARADRTGQLQQLPANPSGPDDAQKLRTVSSIDRELVRKVDALVPPQSEQDQVDTVLDGWRQRAELEEQYADSVAAGDGAMTPATFDTRAAQIDAAADPVATQLGLTQCTGGTS